MENKSNLVKAVIAVMMAVKGIEKNLTVGTGNSSYKGVGDQDVKKAIGEAMAINGLCIFPIDVEIKATVETWTENSQYGDKRKKEVFTEAKTKYLLMHESGESMEMCGYGHGVDSQDKSAGKATTYALKYALLYTFLVPTGKIDDADKTHSDETPPPPRQAEPPKQQTTQSPPSGNQSTTTTTDDKPWLNKTTKDGKLTETWINVTKAIVNGGYTVDSVAAKYKMKKEDRAELLTLQSN